MNDDVGTIGTTEAIDNYDIDQNELRLRGRPLLELVDTMSFVQLATLAISGKTIDRAAAAEVAREASRDIEAIYPTLPERLDFGTCRSGEDAVAITARALLDERPRSALEGEVSESPHMDAMQWHGFLLFWALSLAMGSRLPGLLEEKRRSPRRQNAGAHSTADTDRSLVPWWTALARGGNDEAAIEKLAGCLIGGFGVVAPTTALVRFAASTRAPLEWCLVASAMGCGVSHLGACSIAMQRLDDAQFGESSTADTLAAYCSRKPFPGFGHPVMPVDPRVEYLFSVFSEEPSVAQAQRFAREIRERYALEPNVDFGAGLAFRMLGIPIALGSLLFWLARLPVLIAHALAKYSEPPFGLRSSEIRERYHNIPRTWL